MCTIYNKYTGLQDHGAAHFPAAQHLAGDQVVLKRRAQAINARRREALAHVEGRVGQIVAQLGRIRNVAGTGGARAALIIVLGAAQRVGSLHGATAGKALAEAGDHGVVLDSVRVQDVGHGAETGIDTVKPAVEQVSGEAIEVGSHQTVHGVGAAVVEAHHGAAFEFALHADQVVQRAGRSAC